MNNETRAQLKRLSENNLHWALGARIAVSIEDIPEAIEQAENAAIATQRLLHALKGPHQ